MNNTRKALCILTAGAALGTAALPASAQNWQGRHYDGQYRNRVVVVQRPVYVRPPRVVYYTPPRVVYHTPPPAYYAPPLISENYIPGIAAAVLGAILVREISQQRDHRFDRVRDGRRR